MESPLITVSAITGKPTQKEIYNDPYRLRAIKLSGIEKGKITYKSHHNSGLFGEKYFPNLLSEEAVDYFIKCTPSPSTHPFGIETLYWIF